ncbi:MAG: FtsX-like permease family protein, partial [Nocardioides sp.]
MAVAGARAHRGSLTGTFLVLALAGALLSITGVLFESSARGGGARGATDAAALSAVAGSFGGTASVVVVLVVASTVALALKQRRRELALLRAIGATKRQIRRLIGTELVLVAAVAAPLGAVPALFAARRLTPLLIDGGVVSPGFQLALSPLPVLGAVVVLVPVALLAAALATRETLRTSPTEAVRESAVEPRGVGRGRRLTAAGLAISGLATAGTPLLVPGTVGSASAATSAFLLVGAAAVAGPLLIGWCLDRATVLERARSAPGRLAIANTRGFSRRLTTAIVPLALALTAGTVQSTTDQAVVKAARAQLAAGLRADVIVTAPGPDGRSALTARQFAEVTQVPGVAAAVPVSRVSAQFDVDGWEPTAVSVVPAANAGSVYDLGVVDGSLADLARPDTVAASTDALFASGIHVGDRVRMR